VTQKKRQETEVTNNTPAEKIMQVEHVIYLTTILQAIQARRNQAFDRQASESLSRQLTMEGGIEGGFYNGFSSFVTNLAMMGDNLAHV
jgi:hypothetical protein